ncbi:hypothetical protein LguiA_008322 [Lonicera macranthoides]
MPLSEFYRMGKGKIESTQQRSIPSSTDLSFLGDKELAELVWEDGQIMMQGQPNKNKKSPMSSSTSKIGKFGPIESIFNDFGVSSETGLNQEDEMLRWLNYPVDDNLQQDFCSELLPELSCVTVNEPSTRNNFTLIDKRDHFNQTACCSSSFGSGISDPFSASNRDQTLQKQDYGASMSNSSALNFSHFSKPVANARANLENIVGLPDSGSSGLSPPSKQSHAICQENVIRNDNLLNQTKVVFEIEKAPEPMVASSSVCSANSTERASNDPTNNSKRKSLNSEESESQREDVEDESVGVKKVACGRGSTSSKRSRAAEVHNLSERADKASMLDEAIEYLKTLQLQVQMMSMGAGLYMPPMMLPTRMQQINGAHLPHFSMGMRMGYGIGMQGAHVQHPQHISRPTSFQGLAGSNLQVFSHPTQGSVPMLAWPTVNWGMELSASGTGARVEVPSATPNLNPSDRVEHTNNSQAMHNVGSSSSMPSSTQFQAENEGFDQSAIVRKDDQGTDIGRSADVKTTNANDSAAIPAAGE